MRSTDFCFPLFSTTSTRATFVPSISSRLAPRPFAAGLVPWMMETGGPGGSRRPIRFGGWPPVGARRSSSACSRNHRTSDTPVADPWLPLRLREVRRPPSPPDRACKRSMKIRLPRRSGVPSIASCPAPSAGRTHPRKNGHVSFRSNGGTSVSSPAVTYFRTWGRELGARP